MITSTISKIKNLNKPKEENIVDNDKIVCGCFKVTVQDLVNAIKNGASSFEEVQAITKVGTGCGKCIGGNKALVAQLLAK